MIKNFAVGIDIVAVKKFKDAKSSDPYLKKIFTKKELEYCFAKKTFAESLAARFAAKEAAIKSLSKFKIIPDFADIEVGHDKNQRPYVTIKSAKIQKMFAFDLSISHEDDFAVAVILTEKI